MLGFAHLGAVGIVLALDEWPWPLRLAVVAVLLAAGWHTLRVHGGFGGTPPLRRLTWLADNEWRVEASNGEVLSACAVAPVVAHPLLVVLRLRAANRWLARAVILPVDSLDAETFRRLRVRLQLEGVSPRQDE